MMPFITEEIWQHLPHEGESITIAAWPEKNEAYMFKDAVEDMELLKEIIRSVRNTRAELNVPMSKQIELLVNAKDDQVLAKLNRGQSYIEKFCNPSKLQMGTGVKAPEKSMSQVLTGVELFLPLAGLLDLDAEIARLEKELDKLTKEVER